MNSLRTTDSRSHFEKVFQEGIRQQIITKDAISWIISSGPNGVLQVSEAFGNAFKRSWIQEWQDKFLELISFYLLYAFGDNFILWSQEIKEKGVLELSRQGSALVKNMAKYPEFDTLEKKDDQNKEYEALFKKFSRYQSKETYNEEIERRKNNLKLRTLCIKLYKESGFEWDGILWAEETIITELFPRVITKKSIQSEWEIAIQNKKFQQSRWSDLLSKIPKEFEQFKEQFSFENCFKRYNQIFLGIISIKNEERSKKGVNSYNLNTVFKWKKTRTDIAQWILSAYFFNWSNEKFSDDEIWKIIHEAREKYITIDDLIKTFYESLEDLNIEWTLALEWIESIWNKYVLNDVISVEIAINQLKKGLKITK